MILRRTHPTGDDSSINAFFGYDWVVPIYWTLAVEFQFYLAVGLL